MCFAADQCLVFLYHDNNVTNFWSTSEIVSAGIKETVSVDICQLVLALKGKALTSLAALR